MIAACDLKYAARVGVTPFSTYFTQVRLTPTGTWFSVLQATVQAWHPMHLRLSMTKPYFMGWRSYPENALQSYLGASEREVTPVSLPCGFGMTTVKNCSLEECIARSDNQCLQ